MSKTTDLLRRGQRSAPTQSDDYDVPETEETVNVRVRWGIELDGTQCRAVSIVDGRVRDWAVYHGDTPAQALRQWARRNRVGRSEVRIVWSGPKVEFRQLRTNTEVPVAGRKAVLAEIAEKEMSGTGTDTPSLAGLFAPPDGGSGQPVSLVGIPPDQLDDVWEVIGTRDWSVVPAILLPQPDGVYLAIRSSCAVCYVVVGGRTVYYSELAAKGLDNLSAKIQGTDAESANLGNPAQQVVLNGYLQAVIQETSRWLTNWSNSRAITLPPQLWIYGPGGNLSQLAPGLIEALGRQIDYPDPAAVFPSLGVGDSSQIPDLDQSQAFLACRAALAPVDVLSRLDNPLVLTARAKATERAHNIKMLTALALGLGIIIAVIATPLVLAYRTKTLATNRLNNAQNQATALAAQYKTYQTAQAGQTALHSVTALDPNIQQVFTTLAATQPPTATFQSITATVKETKIAVSIPVIDNTSTPFTNPANWIVALTKAGATDASVGSLTYGKGVETYAVTFSLPLQPPAAAATTTVPPPAPTPPVIPGTPTTIRGAGTPTPTTSLTIPLHP